MKLKHRCRHPLIEVERILQGISWDSGNAGEESPITRGDVADGVNSTLVAAGVDVVELSLPTWEHLWHRVEIVRSTWMDHTPRPPWEGLHQSPSTSWSSDRGEQVSFYPLYLSICRKQRRDPEPADPHVSRCTDDEVSSETVCRHMKQLLVRPGDEKEAV